MANPNDRDPDRDILRKNDNGSNTGTLIGVAIATIVAIGIGWFLMASNNNTVATNPAPNSVGQGTTNITPGQKNDVNPMPPVPPRAPKAQ